MHIAIVGAGLAGLAAAAHLAGNGHSVVVYERGDRPGGRVNQIQAAGFKIDVGPTVLTMPDILDATFAAAGQSMAEHLTLRALDPMYRGVFPDGSVIHVVPGVAAMTAEIEALSGPADAAGFVEFASWLADLHRLRFPHYIDRNFDSAFDLARPLRAAIGMLRLGAHRSFRSRLENHFDDSRLQRLFEFHSLYAGVAPSNALALSGLSTYMDSAGGVYSPVGGVGAIPAALERALIAAGVEFRYGTNVTRILRSGTGAVSGIELNDESRIQVNAVVCNGDLPVAYRTLLGGIERPRVARRGRFAPSAMVWAGGVTGDVPVAAVRHNIHFGGNGDDNVKAVLETGIRMLDPTVLVTVQSNGDATVAPRDHAVISALEPVPHLGGAIDWASDGKAHLDELRTKVGHLGYPTTSVIEQTFDPLDWERLGLERGTPFGLAHTLRQMGPFRPGNIDDRVPGLVFAGASTLPGIGVPLVLVSGKLAAERVQQYLRSSSVVRW